MEDNTTVIELSWYLNVTRRLKTVVETRYTVVDTSNIETLHDGTWPNRRVMRTLHDGTWPNRRVMSLLLKKKIMVFW